MFHGEQHLDMNRKKKIRVIRPQNSISLLFSFSQFILFLALIPLDQVIVVAIGVRDLLLFGTVQVLAFHLITPASNAGSMRMVQRMNNSIPKPMNLI